MNVLHTGISAKALMNDLLVKYIKSILYSSKSVILLDIVLYRIGVCIIISCSIFNKEM